MIAFGMLAALAAATAAAAAAVLQAADAQQVERRRRTGFWLLRVLIHRRRWVLGTALLALAWPLQVLALALAPITVVQPTFAIYAVILLAFAHFWMHGHVSRSDVWGVVAITAGIVLIVVNAPHHDTIDPPASQLIAPVTLVGALALGAYALARVRRDGSLALIVGAGLAYAWADFANKLLSNALSSGDLGLAGIWIATIVAMGALALLEESAALQRRTVVRVSPLIGAVQDPLPILMALWAGVETWGDGSSHIGMLAVGLALVVTGALFLRRRGQSELGAGTLPAQTPGASPS